jgi:hypothetical protein
MSSSEVVLIESFTVCGKTPVKAGAIPGGDDGQSSQNRKHEFKARDFLMTTTKTPATTRKTAGDVDNGVDNKCLVC